MKYAPGIIRAVADAHLPAPHEVWPHGNAATEHRGDRYDRYDARDGHAPLSVLHAKPFDSRLVVMVMFQFWVVDLSPDLKRNPSFWLTLQSGIGHCKHRRF